MMIRHSSFALVVAGGLLLAHWQDLAAAQQPKPAEEADAIALKQQLKEVIARQNAAVDGYNAAIAKIKEGEELKKLDEAANAAQEALSAAQDRAGEAGSAAAKQEFTARLQAIVQAKLAEHPDAKESASRLKQVHGELAAHEWQIVLARLQLDHPLSPINRALAEDANLAALTAAFESAPRNERPAAKAKLEEARDEKLANRKEAQQLLAEIAKADAAIEKLNREATRLENLLGPVRREIEKAESALLKAADPAAGEAPDEAAIEKLRAAYDAAVEAYNARAKELIASDPEAAKWKKEYDEWAAKVAELKKQQK